MKDKLDNVDHLVWLYANGCHETVDIMDSYSKNIMDQFVSFQRNEYMVWIRTKNYLISVYEINGK